MSFNINYMPSLRGGLSRSLLHFLFLFLNTTSFFTELPIICNVTAFMLRADRPLLGKDFDVKKFGFKGELALAKTVEISVSIVDFPKAVNGKVTGKMMLHPGIRRDRRNVEIHKYTFLKKKNLNQYNIPMDCTVLVQFNYFGEEWIKIFPPQLSDESLREDIRILPSGESFGEAKKGVPREVKKFLDVNHGDGEFINKLHYDTNVEIYVNRGLFELGRTDILAVKGKVIRKPDVLAVGVGRVPVTDLKSVLRKSDIWKCNIPSGSVLVQFNYPGQTDEWIKIFSSKLPDAKLREGIRILGPGERVGEGRAREEYKQNLNRRIQDLKVRIDGLNEKKYLVDQKKKQLIKLQQEIARDEYEFRKSRMQVVLEKGKLEKEIEEYRLKV